MNYYMVDTFTEENFKGNPAGVCLMDTPICDELMQNIAREHHLPETAFVEKVQDGYNLRWFTPGFEIDLCGHATLASAFVLFSFIEKDANMLTFHTKSGTITAKRSTGCIEMELPDWTPEQISLTAEEKCCIGIKYEEAYGKRDLILVLESEKAVKEYKPDYERLLKLTDHWLGIVLTSEASEEAVDIVSRYFCPEIQMEDPVTGSSHSSLVPLWSRKLHKKKLVSKQLSERGGYLFCRMENSKVYISGKAKLYMTGEINLN